MNKYTIFKELGRGTYGIVYKAYDKHTKQYVAIKQISKSGEFLNREIEILSLIKKNDYCIQILDIFYSYNTQLYQFIVFEYFPFTLRDFITKNNKENIDKHHKYLIMRIMQKLLQGISCIHSLNIIHRDLKPENILINDLYEPTIVKICDFGCAKIIEENNNPFVVTRYYRAPELIFGDINYSKNIDI